MSSKLYRWVKASERLPGEKEIGTEVVFRLLNNSIIWFIWNNEKDERSFISHACDSWLSEIEADQEGLEFAKWLEANTKVIYEEKITLYRYMDIDNNWGNYTLDDIHIEYLEQKRK